VNTFGVVSDQNYYVRDLLARALRMTYSGEMASDSFSQTIAKLMEIRKLLPANSAVGGAIDELARAYRKLVLDQ